MDECMVCGKSGRANRSGQCVICVWNSLPHDLVMPVGTDNFKKGVGEIHGGNFN